jgi:hypothetical protein
MGQSPEVFLFHPGIRAILHGMKTYFIRHTEALDIDDATRQKLRDERRVAIHFPDDARLFSHQRP